MRRYIQSDRPGFGPEARQGIVLMAAMAAAGVGACVLIPLDNGTKSARVVTDKPACLELRSAGLYADTAGGVSMQILGNTCVALYNYSQGAESPGLGNLEPYDTVEPVCLHRTKPPAIEVVTGPDKPSVAANIGMTFSIQLNEWQADHAGTELAIPDCRIS